MMSSTKMIEKLKQGIQSLEKGVEHKAGELNDEPLSYFMDYLTPAMMEEARTKLKETDENRPKALEELKKLIRNESKLVTITDDAFLIQFLRARKFNVKKAFKLLQNFWLFRKEHRHIFDATNSTSVIQLIMKSNMGALQFRDRNGSAVLIFKVGLWNPEQDVYEDMFRAVTAVLIHSIKFPATQVCGYRIIFDLRGMSWLQLKLLTPSNMILLIRSTQYCFPARYKAFHIISENKLFHLVYAVAYPLLTAKLKNRVIFHGNDVSSLKDYIHPSILPQEYGGQAETFENSKWKDIIDENTDQVLNFLNYGYKD